jgi:hypothetical protein
MEKTYSNAEGGENRGLARRATQKVLKRKELQIDCFLGAVRVAEGRRGRPGTRQQTWK